MPTLRRCGRGGADLFRGRHGLDPDDVGAARLQALDLLDEDLDGLVLGQRPERRKKIARRPDGARDDNLAPRLVGDGAGDLGGKPVQLMGAVLQVVEHQTAAVAAERVGENDVRAGVHESSDEGRGCGPDARRSSAPASRRRRGPWRKDWCRSRRPRAAAGLRPKGSATWVLSKWVRRVRRGRRCAQGGRQSHQFRSPRGSGRMTGLDCLAQGGLLLKPRRFSPWKGLDFLGISRRKRAFSTGYGQSRTKVFI